MLPLKNSSLLPLLLPSLLPPPSQALWMFPPVCQGHKQTGSQPPPADAHLHDVCLKEKFCFFSLCRRLEQSSSCRVFKGHKRNQRRRQTAGAAAASWCFSSIQITFRLLHMDSSRSNIWMNISTFYFLFYSPHIRVNIVLLLHYICNLFLYFYFFLKWNIWILHPPLLCPSSVEACPSPAPSTTHPWWMRC